MYPEVHRVSHGQTAALIAERARPGEWVVDIGGGDGDLAARFEALGLRAVAADPRPARSGVRATWEHLPVRPASLAGVTACASLQYADDAAAAVVAAARALRPGGRLVVALSPVHATDDGARSGETTARRRTGNARYRHFSVLEVGQFFEAAGLALNVIPFRVPGGVGLKRRLKAAIGVDLAAFPTLVGDKPPG